MTYTNLNKYLSANNTKVFDFPHICAKSKAVFIIGAGASNTGAYISSIMTECNIPHSRYINSDKIDIKHRFIKNGDLVDLDNLCSKAEHLIKKHNKAIGKDELLLLLALELLDGNEYLLIEMSEELYEKAIKSIIPYSIVFAINDDKVCDKLISCVPSGVTEIISLCQRDNHDYISTIRSSNGARVSFASPNKITYHKSDLLGTSFFHYSYQYRITAIDQNNVRLAHLAIEAVTALFSPPRPYVYKGLKKARAINDLEIYSLSPTVLLKEGDSFSLHRKMKFKTVTENDKIEKPTENTVFCGSKEFLARVKETIK